MNNTCKVLFGAMLGVLAMGAEKANWPQWQGPNRDNLSTDTGLLKEWPKGGPPLAWKATGLGRGYSSVAIADGKIYTMGTIDGASCVVALDDGGKNLWTAKIGPENGNFGGYPGTRSTPTVAGDKAYAMTQSGDLACVNVADGKIVWQKNMTKDFGGEMMSMWGYSESVLVDGDNVICTPGSKQGAFLALDKNTGAIIWRTKEITDKASYSSFVVATIAGQKQYVKLTDKRVVALKPEDGSVLWQMPRTGATAVIPTPIVRGDDVWVTSGYNAGSQLFHVSAEGGKLTAKQVYANKFCDKHGGDVLVGDYIYGCSERGILTCMKWADGQETWTKPDLGLGSITAADGRLYFRDEKKNMYLIDTASDTCKIISQFPQPDHVKGDIWAHPVVCGGFLYLRDGDILLCYDVHQK